MIEIVDTFVLFVAHNSLFHKNCFQKLTINLVDFCVFLGNEDINRNTQRKKKYQAYSGEIKCKNWRFALTRTKFFFYLAIKIEINKSKRLKK